MRLNLRLGRGGASVAREQGLTLRSSVFIVSCETVSLDKVSRLLSLLLKTHTESR